jgi:hypothetical protein
VVMDRISIEMSSLSLSLRDIIRDQVKINDEFGK